MNAFANRPTFSPFLRLVCILMLALMVAACGRGRDEAAEATTPAAESAVTPAAETADEAVGEESEEATPTAAESTNAESTDSSAEAPATPEASSAEDVSVPPPAEINTGAAGDIEPLARDGMYSAAPPMTIDPSRFYYATLKTERGDIRVQLFADRAPITVNNFVYLAREGFYDNITFHRVLDDFMAQTGDPAGTGGGGPGYEFEDEFYPGLGFDRAGLLAMANRGPRTNGSQFFITFVPTEWLNGGHTIFGEVIEGIEVLDRLTRRDPSQPVSFDGDLLYTVEIDESDASVLPTPTPAPPTATPLPTPTPYAPTSLDATNRPLAEVPDAERARYFNTAPDMVIDTAKNYSATITTTKGDLVLTLYDDQAPIAVNNFVVLANLGFYDNSTFAQIQQGDAVVFGAPDNNAANDAGYAIPAELGTAPATGVGAMAYVPVDQLPDGTVVSSSSQLLIALIPLPEGASARLSFFAQVVEGADLLQQLTLEDTIVSITIAESE